MNIYLKQLCKVEYVITNACTGNCKHCSEGEHSVCGERIDSEVAVSALQRVADSYNIKTVMTFGGEPLLYPDVVCKIHKTAKELGIPHRQLITNGYFSKDERTIKDVASSLFESGVNDLRVSVDAFHQETIPVEIVKLFACAAKNADIPVRTQPAWLLGRDDENPYNQETKRLLREFYEIGIPEGDGNVVFPEGNALKYLGDYFADSKPANPYIEDPFNVKCLSFSPNGDVLNGNVTKADIMEIIENYQP